MPDKPLEISLNISAKELYKNNSVYKKYQNADAQPMGVTFQGYDFPRFQESNMVFKYPDGEFKVDGVMSINSYDNVKKTDSLLTSYDVTFIYNKDSDGITDKDAYNKTMQLFKELQGKGWVSNKNISAPRLSAKDSFKFTIDDEGSKYYLDFKYPLTFDEWMQLSNIHKWELRYGSNVFMDIDFIRDTNPDTGKRHYLMGLTIRDQVEIIKEIVGPDNRHNWEEIYAEIYSKIPIWRLESEDPAIKMGLKIQQDQPDYTLPLVLEKTGIDTSKFVSIDPYKITKEEFIKRSEAGEDMTPYYEDQPETKPEIINQARGRCPTNKPCPKSGYWHTLAKADSRAYFRQGDIMPDYPNNNWGEVIWQFDGEEG
ncbi:hypothetical protein [Psychrobacter sp. DAB_AL43B]|uniref:hypothetical protein n=1 Tax=Psychrobacter sp. DAB_AL43B TaxID=1028416 RepID=UPI0009A6A93B|nr:hypothetical protein [Psychrobacter sp. DAB_AL43B]